MASYSELFASIPIGWLTRAPNAQQFWASWGKLLDDQAARSKDSTKASFPDYAPTDALARLQHEYGIFRDLFSASPESDANFSKRLKNAFNFWQYGGSPLGLLLQLYFLGYSNLPTLSQNNGLGFKLNSSAIAGDLSDYSSFMDKSLLTGSPSQSVTATLTGTFVTGDKYLFQIVPSATAGSLVAHEGTGTGTIAISGTLTGYHSLLISITTGGAAAATVWKYFVDGDSVGGSHTGTPFAFFLVQDTNFLGAKDDCYAVSTAVTPSWWTSIRNPPTDISSPSASEINLIFRALETWQPGKARCLYWQDPLVKFGNPTPDGVHADALFGTGVQFIGYTNGSATPGAGYADFVTYNPTARHVVKIEITANGTRSTCNWRIRVDLSVIATQTANPTITTTVDAQTLVVTLRDSSVAQFKNGDVLEYSFTPFT